MAVDPVEEFDREDLTLSPEMHQAQAEMAEERGEDYDPYEFEQELERTETSPDLDEAEPVEGADPDDVEQWRNS